VDRAGRLELLQLVDAQREGDVHAEPLKSPSRGSVNRPERVTNKSRRSNAATSALQHAE
jgi:hypothetical protein